MIAARQEGRPGAAGLDVATAERRVPAALRALPNAVLTPRAGSLSVETRQAMGPPVLDQRQARCAGLPLGTPVP